MFQVAEIEIRYVTKVKAADRPRIGRSADVYHLLIDLWPEGTMEWQERFYMLLLNRANQVIGAVELSAGGQAGTVCDPKHVYGIALKANAAYIIVAHNHPSGNLSPSNPDIELTKKLISGGKLLELNLLDHLILSSEGYYSFADDGLI